VLSLIFSRHVETQHQKISPPIDGGAEMVVNEKRRRKFAEDLLSVVRTFASHIDGFFPLIDVIETVLFVAGGENRIYEEYIAKGGQRHDLIQALREYNIEWFLSIARAEIRADPGGENFVTAFWRGFEGVSAESLTSFMPWKLITHMYNQINIDLSERCARRVYQFNELYHSFLDNMSVAFPPADGTVDLPAFFEKHIMFLRPMVAFDLFKSVVNKSDPTLLSMSLGTVMQFKDTDCSAHEIFQSDHFAHTVSQLPFVKQLSLTPELWKIQFVENPVNRRYVCNTICQLINTQMGIPKTLIPADLTAEIQLKIADLQNTIPRTALQNPDGTPNIAAILAHATGIVRSLKNGQDSALEQLQLNMSSQKIDIDHDQISRMLSTLSADMPADMQLLCTVGMGARDPFQEENNSGNE
jgi:hypothetical protein